MTQQHMPLEPKVGEWVWVCCKLRVSRAQVVKVLAGMGEEIIRLRRPGRNDVDVLLSQCRPIPTVGDFVA